MPIRFRCPYCNQLMGIARRKAGTVVRCPKCNGQLVVPDLQEEAPGEAPPEPPPPPLVPPPPPPPPPPPAAAPQLAGDPLVFERNDFEDIFVSLKKGSPAPGSSSPPKASAPPGGAPPAVQEAPQPQSWKGVPAGRTGGSEAAKPALTLSARMVTVLSIVLIVVVALAFAVGVLVGRHYLRPTAREGRQNNPGPPMAGLVTGPESCLTLASSRGCG